MRARSLFGGSLAPPNLRAPPEQPRRPVQSEAATLRVLDASLNRAAEGARVVEDFARFVLDDGGLARMAKELRHDLAAAAPLSRDARLAARDAGGDVGAAITTDAEVRRSTAWDVCIAGQERLQQALRTLEEFSKTVDTPAATAFERLRYRAYTLGKAVASVRRARERLAEARLCVLVDGADSASEFKTLVESLYAAGADLLQLRDKRLDDRGLLGRAGLLAAAARAAGAIAIVNDRPDIAAAAGADGVHVGQDDLPVAAARSIVGVDRLVGVSTHSIEQLRRAVLDGADYAGLGPTFPTPTKAFDAYPGLDYLAEAAAETALPAFAIGGVTAENLPQLLGAGATRIAVASAVTAAADPPEATRRLKRLVESAGRAPAGG